MMKTKITFLTLVLSILLIQYAAAQTLLKSLTGKWKVVKYQDQLGPKALADTIEFKENGTFSSDSIYFRDGEGLFRTDETRSLLVTESGDSTTEWSVAFSKDVLRLQSVSKKKQPGAHMTLVKVKP